MRYPDPAVHVLDPRFDRYRIGSAAVERVATGCRWNEGPVWFGDHRCLLWSDIPNDRIMRWDEQTGETTVFRAPSNFANGGTRDLSGRLVSCEHLTRRITRTEHDGTITVLADKVGDAGSTRPTTWWSAIDGAVWFSDPGYGIMKYYEGDRAEPELPTRVYRHRPGRRRVEPVIDELERPNGLCFSPDESLLYVVDSGSARTITVYDIVAAPDRRAGVRPHGRRRVRRHPVRRRRQPVGRGRRRRRGPL